MELLRQQHPPPGAAALAEAIRGHRGIENRLHWHLDVSFGEDACRVRKGHGAENFSRLRRVALDLLHREATNNRGIKIKRQRRAGTTTTCYGSSPAEFAIALGGNRGGRRGGRGRFFGGAGRGLGHPGRHGRGEVAVLLDQRRAVGRQDDRSRPAGPLAVAGLGKGGHAAVRCCCGSCPW